MAVRPVILLLVIGSLPSIAAAQSRQPASDEDRRQAREARADYGDVSHGSGVLMNTDEQVTLIRRHIIG